MTRPLDAYRALVADGEITSDPIQEKAMQRLQALGGLHFAPYLVGHGLRQAGVKVEIVPGHHLASLSVLLRVAPCAKPIGTAPNPSESPATIKRPQTV